MSIRFSEVKASDMAGFFVKIRLDGHPDEDDIRGSEYFLRQASRLTRPLRVSVQQYCFLTDSNEEDADCNHFALMDAYDELVEYYEGSDMLPSPCWFTDRDDVEHDAYFEFQVEEDISC